MQPSEVPPAVSVSDFGELTLAELQQLPLRELLGHFAGDVEALKVWLDVAKKHADTREKELRNLETTGQVVARDLVAKHVFGAIEASHARLLGDMPQTVTRRLYAMARADEELESAEAVVREIVATILRRAVTSAREALAA